MRNHLGPGVIGAAGLGAGLMFFLDPDISNRRRAILRDKLVSLGHLAGWAADKPARGVRNCLNGALQSIRSRVRDTPPSDVVLMERVRSKMGRAVSHPHAIHVNVQNGRVRLTGEILSEELDDLIRSVSAVKGVKEIENQLTTYAEPGDISSLQGGYTRRGSRFALLQSNWSPANPFDGWHSRRCDDRRRYSTTGHSWLASRRDRNRHGRSGNHESARSADD